VRAGGYEGSFYDCAEGIQGDEDEISLKKPEISME
jgi:hypothetical protein